MTADDVEHDLRLARFESCAVAEPRILHSEELFAGQRTVVIQHGDEQYRLLITRNDRLILQK